MDLPIITIVKQDIWFGKSFTEDFKLRCFSESLNDELLWAHYSDAGKGVCLEYSSDSLNKIKEYIFPVIYVKRPVCFQNIFDKIDETNIIDVKQLTLIQYASLISKSISWSYEKEWRLISPLNIKSQFDQIHPSVIYFGPRFLSTDNSTDKESKQRHLNLRNVILSKGIKTKLVLRGHNSFTFSTIDINVCELIDKNGIILKSSEWYSWQK